MFKALWQAILRALGRDEQVEVRPIPRTPKIGVEQKSKPEQRQVIVEVSPKSTPHPPPPRKTYEGLGFEIDDSHRALAKAHLFFQEDGKTKGPTSDQERVVFSDLVAIPVIAGAGSGKSTTLVSRVLFLHKILDIPLGNMSVFTFTRKSRADFIEKLVEEAKRWNVQLSEKKAQQLVRTFHSKALQVARGLLRSDEKIFEFLGKDKTLLAEKPETEIDEGTAATDLPTAEIQANEIDGFVALDESAEQAEILKDVYSKCYNSDDLFKESIATLFEYTMISPSLKAEKKYQDKLQFLRKMSLNDQDLCAHLEQKWTAQGNWPIPGVRLTTPSGERHSLSVMGTEFFANGYIESLDIYVVLGRYDGISNAPIGESKIKPNFSVNDKRLVLLTGCKKKVRFVNSKKDAERLKTQLELNSQERGLSAPALDIRLPGELSPKPVFSVLYALGVFIENLGLEPDKQFERRSKAELSKAERAAMYATSRFFKQFYNELKARNLVTFNQIFMRLGKDSPDLEKIDVSSLIGAKHLMIDEFQDISPLIVKFVQGLHEELLKKSEGEQIPTLMCVGDDWQSIYGWRGSSPHFFLEFHEHFDGATSNFIKLRENFRSTQEIINCGESFIGLVIRKSKKNGIASNDKVKNLPFKVIAVEKFARSDVENTLLALLEKAGAEEKVYLLAAKHDDLVPFKAIRDHRLVKTTFHQSKGLEAEYVVLLGAPKFFGVNNLKTHIYELGAFPQAFDQAQRDEALRVAYVASTRAKKLCIWFAEATGGNVLEQVPADGKNRSLIDVTEVRSYIDRFFQHQVERKVG